MQPPACPKTDCPLAEEAAVHKLEEEIAEAAASKWWRGFPWTPFGILCGLLLSMTGYIWSVNNERMGQSEKRLERLESQYTELSVQNAVQNAQLSQIYGDLQIIKGILGSKNNMVEENNKMLKAVLDKMAHAK